MLKRRDAKKGRGNMFVSAHTCFQCLPSCSVFRAPVFHNFDRAMLLHYNLRLGSYLILKRLNSQSKLKLVPFPGLARDFPCTLVISPRGVSHLFYCCSFKLASVTLHCACQGCSTCGELVPDIPFLPTLSDQPFYANCSFAS